MQFPTLAVRFWNLRKTVLYCERHVLCAAPVNELKF